MNKRECLITALRGGNSDRIPWTIYKWILDNVDPGAASRMLDRGLIPIDSECLFKRIYDKTVTMEIREEGEGRAKKVHTTFITPLGRITEEYGFDETIGSKWISEHFIKELDDYKVLQYVFENTTIVPDYDRFEAADKAMGDQGIVLGEVIPIPLVWLWVNYMGVDVWSEGLLVYTEEFNSLHSSLVLLYEQMIRAAADSPAEVIWFGDNVTGSVISPDTYSRFCMPVYEKACHVLHEAGKLTFAHYDGDNFPLKDLIGRTGLDVIEAFTPPPMEKMTVEEARKAWPDKVLSLNFPGNLFREPSEVIEKYCRLYIEEAGDRKGFIIGCTEEFEFEMFEKTFSAIAEGLGL